MFNSSPERFSIFYALKLVGGIFTHTNNQSPDKKTNTMRTQDCIQLLQAGKPLRLFDNKERHYVQFQRNRKTNRICWQRFISKDKVNWHEVNSYLDLNEVLILREGIIVNNKTTVALS